MAGSQGDGGRRDRASHYRRAALRHPLRRRIARLLLDGGVASAAEIAVELDRPLGRVGYHLRVLIRRGALKGVARGVRPPAYRWPETAGWVREMLSEGGEFGEERP